MHPAATVFLDVCVQRDVGPDGTWPLMTREELRNVGVLFDVAGQLGLRQGGVVCEHGEGAVVAAGVPSHCLACDAGLDRPGECMPRLPIRVWRAGGAIDDSPPLDRTHALYLASGCQGAPDGTPKLARGFEHLVAGVRDAVVFGGGVEYGLEHLIGALLRRRIRTHVVLDAAGAADPVNAQVVVARWKRRAVDGVMVATIRRLLTAS